METRHQIGLSAFKIAAQRFCEESMIAIPTPLLIELRDKKVFLLQLFKISWCVCLPGHGATERAIEAVEQRGVDQKQFQVFGLLMQDFFIQTRLTIAIIAFDGVGGWGDI